MDYIKTHTKVFGGMSSHDFNVEWDKMTNSRFFIRDVVNQIVPPSDDAHINYMENGWITVHYFNGLHEIWMPKTAGDGSSS